MELSDFKKMSDDELLKFLQKWRDETARGIAAAAWAVAEVDRRGLEWPDPMVAKLRAINRGIASPALALMPPKLFTQLATLPLKEQEDLAAGKPVPYVDDPTKLRSNGEPETRLVKITGASKAEINQLIGEGVVRTPLQQIRWLKSLPQRRRVLREVGERLTVQRVLKDPDHRKVTLFCTHGFEVDLPFKTWRELF